MAALPTVWNTRSSPSSSQLNAVTYGNGMFVAVGNNTTILTSPEGINWTALVTRPLLVHCSIQTSMDRPCPRAVFQRPRIGRHAIFDDEVIDAAHDKMRDFQWKPKKFFAVADRVVVLGHETGWGRVSDLKLDAPMMHLWTVEGGKLVRCEGFHYPEEWRSALGLNTTEEQPVAA
jgi:hypothetical protein